MSMFETAEEFWGHPDNFLQPGEERAIRDEKTKQVLGVIRHTLGGFFRAYSYLSGCGWGPFMTYTEAFDWVHKKAVSIPRYSHRRILGDD